MLKNDLETKVMAEIDLSDEEVGLCDACDDTLHGGEEVFCESCYNEALAAEKVLVERLRETLHVDDKTSVGAMVQMIKEDHERVEVFRLFVKTFKESFANLMSFFPN